MIVDSHCHLNLIPDTAFGGVDKVVDEAKRAGVIEMLCVSVSLPEIPEVLACAERYESVFASVGIHPCVANTTEYFPEDAIRSFLNHDKVIAIGETGLDFYHQESLDRDRQMACFFEHIKLAKTHQKPLIIHSRQSAKATVDFLRQEGKGDVQGVFHCFSEDYETAKRVLDLGFYLSFSGVLTFKSAGSLRDVARRLPRNRVLVETDSPYLSPVPYRGKTNKPAHVVEVARVLAELWQCDQALVCEHTTFNYRTLFKS
jgi:TatD DNase family protein